MNDIEWVEGEVELQAQVAGKDIDLQECLSELTSRGIKPIDLIVENGMFIVEAPKVQVVENIKDRVWDIEALKTLYIQIQNSNGYSVSDQQIADVEQRLRTVMESLKEK